MKKAASLIKLFALIGLMILVSSCSNSSGSLTSEQSSVIKDSVEQMVESIARDISHEGPLAWLRYFENSPDFFMAADGQLVFPDNHSATSFLKNTYAKSVAGLI
jgi:hypothetical protein